MIQGNIPSINIGTGDYIEKNIITPKMAVMKAQLERKNDSLLPEDYTNKLNSKRPTKGLKKIEFVRVVDGDTIIAIIDGVEERIRFIGMDTPESVSTDESKNTKYGEIASDYLKKVMDNNNLDLYIEYDEQLRDSYDRIPGYVWMGDTMLNELMVSEGYGEIDTFAGSTNIKYETQFKNTQGYAIQNEKGFWAQGADKIDEKPPFKASNKIPQKGNRYDEFGNKFTDSNVHHNNSLGNQISKKFEQNKESGKLNTSFSGVDTKLTITFKGGKPVYVGEAQTVTYSLFRPIEPVYSLGSSKPTGFVRGQRTIAGSVIFTVFDRNVLLNAFYNAYSNNSNSACVDKEYLTDELPPFDMHLTFMNEYGVSAALVIYGCYIPTEGQVHSVEDMITENTIQYVAQDMTLMRPGDIS